MKLPKLYRPVKVKFWSLRNGVGGGLGMIFDIDTEVERTIMRVMGADGWQWQIVGYSKLLEWDYFAETDQDTLNEYRDEIIKGSNGQ